MATYGALQLNDDGSIRPFLPSEIAAIGIETLGIEDGNHPVYTREVNQSTITCEYLINPDQFETFVAYMLGGSKTYIDTSSGGILRLSRLMPQVWPTKPQFAAVKIPSTSGHQFVTDDNASASFPIPTFTKMRVPVVFQHMPFGLYADLEPDGSVNETRRYCQLLPSSASIEYLTLPGGILKFKQETGTALPDGVSVPHNIGKPLVQTVISMRWVRVPFDAWTPGSSLYNRVFGAAEDDDTICSGCINDNVFQGYQPGQLLFVGVDDELKLDPLGDEICWDLTYKFLLKPNGHNYFYWYPTAGSGDAGWFFVCNDDTWRSTPDLLDGRSLFNARPMYNLFHVGT